MTSRWTSRYRFAYVQTVGTEFGSDLHMHTGSKYVNRNESLSLIRNATRLMMEQTTKNPRSRERTTNNTILTNYQTIMTTPKLPPRGNSTPPPYQALFLKILFILLILLLLPELVDSRGTNNTTKKRRKLTVAYNILRDGCSSGTTIRDEDSSQIDEKTTATTATATAATNKDDCSRILIEENEMCITRCMSDVCFENVYAGKLLEMGEVDESRERIFEKCVKDEMKVAQAEARRALQK